MGDSFCMYANQFQHIKNSPHQIRMYEIHHKFYSFDQKTFQT